MVMLRETRLFCVGEWSLMTDQCWMPYVLDRLQSLSEV
jgi:hypothetical protein